MRKQYANKKRCVARLILFCLFFQHVSLVHASASVYATASELIESVQNDKKDIAPLLERLAKKNEHMSFEASQAIAQLQKNNKKYSLQALVTIMPELLGELYVLEKEVEVALIEKNAEKAVASADVLCGSIEVLGAFKQEIQEQFSQVADVVEKVTQEVSTLLERTLNEAGEQMCICPILKVTRSCCVPTLCLQCCATLNSLLNVVIQDIAEVSLELEDCCATLNSKIDNLSTVTAVVDLTGVYTSINAVESSIQSCCSQLSSQIEHLTVTAAVDLTGVYTSLNQIESSINSLVTTVTADFNGTFTMLNAIESNLQSCCTTLNSEINALTITVTTDFAGTFTMLNQIESSINNLVTTVTADFNGTFTMLNAIESNLQSCCTTLNSELNALIITVTTDFAGTFTMLNLIESSINSLSTTVTSDFAGTFTALAKIDADLLACCSTLNSEISSLVVTVTTDFAGTFTMLNQIESSINNLVTTVTADFNGTFTMLNAIESNLQSCCTTLNSEINALVITVTTDFAGTFTMLNQIESSINSLATTVTNDFAGTFTALAKIDADLLACCSTLNSEINSLATTVTTDFYATFTTLNQIQSSINNISTGSCTVDFHGTYTMLNLIESSINSLTTTVTTDFYGTFTMLNAIESSLQSCCTTLNSEINSLAVTVTTDFYATFTTLNQIQSSINNISTGSCTVDFYGTYTMLNLIESSINSLTATVTTDFAGTFTALAKIDADLLACCSTLNSELNALIVTVTTDFNGTFTMLNLIESSVNSLATTITADFNGTFTMLNLIESSINSLSITVTSDFAGTFTVLAKIDADLLNCCSTLSSELNALIVTVTTDFNGTFTMLNLIESSVNSLATTVTTDFAYTWSLLNNLSTCSVISFSGGNITSPGNYCLANNLTSGVTISANNVMLNLNGHSINTTGNGITANSVSELVIRNGIIQNTSGANSGIAVTGVNNLLIEDLQFNNNSMAITCSGCAGFVIEKTQVLSGANSASNPAISMISSNNGVLRTTEVTAPTTPFVQAVLVQDSQAIVIQNCSSFNNTSGFSYLTSTSLTTVSAVTEYCTATGGASGFGSPTVAQGTQLLVFSNCTTLSVAAFGWAIASTNAQSSTICTDCVAKNMTNFGFYVDSLNFTAERCVAHGTDSSSGFILITQATGANNIDTVYELRNCSALVCGGTGFVFEYTDGAKPVINVTNCSAQECAGGFSAQGGTGSSALYVNFNKCAAIGGTSNSQGQGFFCGENAFISLTDCDANFFQNYGYQIESPSIATFNNCRAIGNAPSGFYVLSSGNTLTNCLSTQGSGDGFTFNGGSSNSIINCQAMQNGGNGFNLQSTGTGCTVGQCTATNNGGTGFIGNGNATTLVSGVRFYQNVANGNGTNFDQFSLPLQQIIPNPIPVFDGSVITSSGSYALAQNLAVGITIAANDVVFDLNGHTLDGSITANSVSNLVIRNGTIENTSGAGINATAVNNLLIQDMQFNNNSMAITCSTCTGFVIEKTQVLSGANSSGNTAINIISSTKGVLRTTEVAATTTPFAQAVLVQDSEGIIIQNCASLNNTAGFIYATSTSANTVAAVTEYCTATGGTLAFGNSSNSAGIEKLVFNNCVAQQKTSSTSTGWQVQSNNTQSSIACVDCVTENAQIGFSVQTFNFTADRCTANNSSSVGISLATQPRTNSVDSIYTLRNCSSTTSQNMAGFQIQDTTNATQTPAINIIDCSAQGSVTGFSVQAGTTPVWVNLKGCVAQQGNNNNAGIGFSFTGLVVAKLTDCDSNYNSSHGYLINASCTATFNNCRALNNQGSGFYLLGNNATLINCLATQNSSDGFTVGSGVTNNSIIDCQATQNLGNGFNLSSAGTGCTVGQCTATNNDQMGFVGNGNATTLVSNVRFYQNVANSNTFGNFDQYSLPLQQIIPNPIPVFDGSVITSSGSYALAQNLAVSIIIEANDVVFDLNGHTLDGYITAASVSNLVIKNGIIENPTGRTGISATNVNNLLIQDVQFNSNSTAIQCQNCSNFVIERVHVMSGANAANIQAIVLANSNSGTLRSIEVQSLLSQFQVALTINGGLGLEIKDFLSQNNQSGFFLSSGSSAISAVVENCTVEGSTDAAFTNNNASGSMQLVFNNCIAQQVGIGWLFQNTNLTASIICSDCIVDGISSSAITNYGGFNIQCYNFSAYRCFVNQLNNISAGFTLTNQANGTNDSNYLLKECLVSTSSLSSGYVVNGSGTGLDLNPTIDILDCSAQGCNIGYTEFINVTNAFHPNFVRCTAQGCISDGFSVGSNVVLTNCISNNNGGNGYNANNSGFTASFNGCSAQGNTLNGFSVPSASNSYIFNRCNSISNKQNGYSFLSTGTISAFDCNATNNTQSGFNIVGSGVSTAMLSGCNSNGNTGAGYTINNSSSKAMAFKNCSAYSNSPGFVVSGSGPNSIIGCLSSQNSGNGFDLSASTQATVGANVVGQCTATSNTGTGFVGNGNSSTLVSTVRFYQNMASGNGINFDQYSLPLQQIIPNPIPVYGDTVITSSGSYALAQNLATGLTISANDVVLDLNGHTIVTTGNGILISSGQQNIKIKNGRITNSVNPSVGISGAGNNQNIIIEGVDFFNCYNAINIASGSTDIYIKNVNSSEGGGVINVTAGTCEITGCAVSDASQGGFVVVSTSCSMRNCTTLNVTGVANFSITSDEAVLDTCFVNGGSVVGFLLACSANTKGATLMNCVCQGISAGIGFSLIYPQNFNFITCSAIDCASDGFGYSSGTAGTGQSVVFNGCTALNNNGNGFNYVTLNTSANFVFRNCQANKNGNAGFQLTSMTNATLSDCQAINNGGDGIALNTVTNSALTRCYSFNNAGVDGGIYLNNCQNSSILQCVSHQNADNGIEINNVTNCTIDNCFTTSNPGSGIEISGTNGSQKLAIKNSASSGNANHGFDIGGGGSTSFVSIDDCSALNNGAQGFNCNRSNSTYTNCSSIGNGQFGFSIDTSKQVFSWCVAENNGDGFATFSSATNITISECKSSNNSGNGFNMSGASSISTGRTVSVEQCSAIGNATGFTGNGTTLATNPVFYLNNAMGNTTNYNNIAGAVQFLVGAGGITYGANLKDA